MDECFTQAGYGVRFGWGPVAASVLAAHPARTACLVVVDVLSFSTAVTVAAEAGIRVFPYRWRDESAAGFAAAHDAELAVGRRAGSAAEPWSLSPAALRRAPFAPRLVLPSPNGSTIAAAADGATVVAGSLRNAAAVGRWAVGQGYGTAERPVVVVAAGERWPDGSLRPALEDLLGAGAVIAAVRRYGGDAGRLAPEVSAAAAAAEGIGDVAAAVTECASGRELIDAGFAEDVAVATEIDASTVVPVLRDGAFTAAEPARQR